MAYRQIFIEPESVGHQLLQVASIFFRKESQSWNDDRSACFLLYLVYILLIPVDRKWFWGSKEFSFGDTYTVDNDRKRMMMHSRSLEDKVAIVTLKRNVETNNCLENEEKRDKEINDKKRYHIFLEKKKEMRKWWG